MSVAIVTDSTADLDPAEATGLSITVVPLSVTIGAESYLDGRGVSAAEFFQLLERSETLPRTSAPAPGAFLDAYNEAAKFAESVLCITISSKLSATFNSATAARGLFQDPSRIVVLDSSAATAAEATGVLAAAEAARSGLELSDVVAIASGLYGRQEILVGLETLQYLHRGGRIGSAAAFLGGMLNVKPLLTLRRGEIAPSERVRTRKRMIERLYQFSLSFPEPETIRIAHAAVESDANDLARSIRAERPEADVQVAWMGPAIGVYAGPGAIGVAVVPKAAV